MFSKASFRYNRTVDILYKLIFLTNFIQYYLHKHFHLKTNCILFYWWSYCLFQREHTRKKWCSYTACLNIRDNRLKYDWDILSRLCKQVAFEKAKPHTIYFTVRIMIIIGTLKMEYRQVFKCGILYYQSDTLFLKRVRQLRKQWFS